MNNVAFIGHMTEGSYEPVKLDVKDRRILYELSKNARMSITNIAKRVGLSREVVNYRLDVMMKKGILSGYTTLVDVKKLNKIKHIVYLQLKNFDKIWENRLLDKLIKDKNIVWVATCGGKWDIGLLIASNGIEEFDKIVAKITMLCGKYLNDYLILNEVKEDYLGLGLLVEGLHESKGYYIRDSGSFRKELENRKAEQIKYSKKDIEILKLLLKDTRMTISDIAKSLAASPQFVKGRIKALIRSDIIFGFMPMISFYMQDYQWHMLFLRFNMNEKEENRLITYCRQHPNILWYVKCLGRWNMQLSVFAKGSTHFKEILNNLRTEFSGSIKDYESIMIFNQYKYFHVLE